MKKQKEIKYKKFMIDGKVMQFNFSKFKDLFSRFALDCGCSLTNYEEIFAESLGIGVSTVHGWRLMKNSPKDIESITEIASFFGISSKSLLVELHEVKEGELKMNTQYNKNNTMEVAVEKYETCSYFTKEAIKKAYHMISDFIYADDCENTYGYVELAVKIRNMRGILPDELHEKLLNFVTTEVREWMIYDVPDIVEIEDIESDGDVELASAVLDTPFSVLRNLHVLAEEEMEPYLGSKKYEKEAEISDEDLELKNLRDIFSSFKKIEAQDVSEERVTGILSRCQILIHMTVDEEGIVREVRSYGHDGGRYSWYGKTVEQNLLYSNEIEHQFDVAYLDNANGNFELNLVDSHLVPDEEIPLNIVEAALNGPATEGYHHEFYVTKRIGDIERFGGELESDFLKSWMIAANR